MRCRRCRHENRPLAKFCEQCAALLSPACPSCGSPLLPTARFCSECAHPVAGPADPARFASPESYTPEHLVEKILTSKAALEGERKQVTVLFADLKGSMELLADRDPEEARRILDPVLERMMEAVHHYEGTVNQVMGDGIMALFGAPVAHEDHALRACYAALRMQQALRAYSDELRRTEGIRVEIRVGLNSGEVVVRAIGSDLRMDYTAVGQTTHLAARMEQLATPGSILLAPDTLRLVEGYVQVTPLGPTRVKGLDGPVEVYELTGAGPVRTRIQASAAGGLTRFVGRGPELDQLHRALRLAGEGRGQVVAVLGEPGVGKSRLVYELTHSQRARGWLRLESGSVSYGKATSYLPVIDLLKAYFKIQDRDDQREIREKVTGKLLALDRALDPLLPPFLALLDVPVDDRRWQVLDPPERRRHTLDAVKRLLLRESQVQPLLLIFEDLHWVDGETQALLDGLVESLATARVLLLVNYRPEYQHGWGSKTYYTQIRLDALGGESASELLHALLGDDARLDPVKTLLIARTEGNPFFLEEWVRALAETGALTGERGAYGVARPDLLATDVPPTVQSLLAARIDRLPPAEKQLLQAASVIGHETTFALLAAISDLSEPALRAALAHLQAMEFVYEASLFPDLAYTFKHALTHEVAYHSLLQEARQRLHGRIFETIERLYASRLAEHVERLAHHAVRAKAWTKAVRYLRQAGAKAVERSANREAVALFEAALAAVRQLPETREVLEHAIDLRLDLRNALHTLGDFDQMLPCLEEARALAEKIGDQRRLGRALSYLTQSSVLVSDYERARELGGRALAIGRATQDVGVQVMSNFYLSLVGNVRGDHREAAVFLRSIVGSLDGALVRERFGMNYLPAVTARAHLAWALAELGDFGEAIAWAEEGLRIAEDVGHAHSRIFADTWVGFAYLRQGELDRALRPLERGLALCRATDSRFLFAFVAAFLGSAHVLAGRGGDGLALLEEAAGAARAIGIRVIRLITTLLAEAYLRSGRQGEAAHLAEEGLQSCREHQERGWEAWTLRLLGEIRTHGHSMDAEGARASYQEAMTLAERLGMRPLVAHCHLGLGELFGRTGKRDPARAQLAAATAMYHEMEMRWWRERAEAASRAFDVPARSP